VTEPFAMAEEAVRRARESWGLDPDGDSGDTPLSPPDQAHDQQERLAGDTGDSGDTPAMARPRVSWTAAELVATEFPEPRWAVPDVVPEGCILLAGPPKVGKSWLTLGLGLSVASGGKALGRLDVPAGEVLYLALEDTPRRLKDRLVRMLAGDPAPAAMTLATTCPPLPEGGAKRIGLWLDAHPDARLVVVDVFTRMRGPRPPGASLYEADYNAVAQMKAVADTYGVALVLVVHVRKADAEDFLETISGTNGLAAAADAVAVLRRARGKADGVLQITGRDVEEAIHALEFSPALGAWQLLEGPADEHLLANTRAAILAAVRQAPGIRPRQLADKARLDYDLVKQTVRRMVEVGQLDTDGNGHYFVTAVPPVPGVTAVTGVTDDDLDDDSRRTQPLW
jgi:AAA domain